MESTHDRLMQPGIVPLSSADTPDAYAAVLRIARQLRSLGRRVIALCPADEGVVVAPFAVQLALVLSEVAESMVTVVQFDASARLLPEWASEGREVAGLRSAQLTETVTILEPDIEPGPSALADIETFLLQARRQPGFVLADTSDLRRTGNHLRAYFASDAVLVLARAHRTRERELLDRYREVPAELNLGVLLLG